VFRGGVPASQSVAMRAPFQEGDFPGPVKYCYLNVGAVEHDALPRVMARLAARSLPALCHTITYEGA
jgi:hypothetical protein